MSYEFSNNLSDLGKSGAFDLGEIRKHDLELNAEYLRDWISRQNNQLELDVSQLQDKAPTLFDDNRTVIDGLMNAARLAGRREILDALQNDIAVVAQQLNQ